MLRVMLCVFKLDEEEEVLKMYDGNKKIADSSLLSNRREVDTGMFRIDNGRYAIIPCTHVIYICRIIEIRIGGGLLFINIL